MPLRPATAQARPAHPNTVRRGLVQSGLALASAAALLTPFAVAQDTPKLPPAPVTPKAPAAVPPPAPPPKDTTPADPKDKSPKDKDNKDKQPATTASPPANPASGIVAPSTPAQAKPEAPTWGPFIERTNTKHWLMTAYVRINSNRSDATKTVDVGGGKQARVPEIVEIPFHDITVVWPSVPVTASSESVAENVSGVLRLDGHEVVESPRILDSLYQSGTKLLAWQYKAEKPNETTREVSLQVTLPVAASQTKFQETEAMKLPWPAKWPVDAALTFGSQGYVDHGPPLAGKLPVGTTDPYDPKILQDKLDSILQSRGITDPKKEPIVRLAKVITSAVWEEIQFSGDGLTFHGKTGELAGLALQGPAKTLEDKRGSHHDSAVLLAALMRRAGIPTRLVVGFDVSSGGEKFLLGGKKENKLRSWVEFCLYDENANTVNWVPIDITRLRKLTSRPMPLERTWKYFGTHDELSEVIPFSLHFHPPTDVVTYGAPAFWGWNVSPAIPGEAVQAMMFTASKASKRPDRPEDEKTKKGVEEKPSVKRGKD